jgi:hypothetical protein
VMIRCGQRIPGGSGWTDGCPKSLSERCYKCGVALCSDHTHRATGDNNQVWSAYCREHCPVCIDGSNCYHGTREPVDAHHRHYWTPYTTEWKIVQDAPDGQIEIELTCSYRPCPVIGTLVINMATIIEAHDKEIKW